MSVRKNDVFHLTGIQTHLLQSVQNFIFRGVVEQRLDDDNALAADDRPCAMDLGTHEIKVIRDFGRFGIPGFPGRRTATCPTPGLGPGWTWNAKAEERPRPIRTSRNFGLCEVTVDRPGRCLRGRYDRREKNRANTPDH